ncbi:hypothetical protein PL321_15640 [Caloramator sp. mosi_1]|uniref:hypothetical protein n=1 Tax=Caloramator sp. mosi_1 TaxID=3023090 RepID=UPI00235EE10F|nr:hypothetical protein [Caloramator sp. mosi_1]WDC83878.1 hypothetical protein PL321_15640 [Caloramator sp. mosi_1]
MYKTKIKLVVGEINDYKIIEEGIEKYLFTLKSNIWEVEEDDERVMIKIKK